MDALKKAFRPEFINRMDSVIVFHALNRVHIRKIAEMELAKVAERLKEREIDAHRNRRGAGNIRRKGI